jgi:hypothetical protein
MTNAPTSLGPQPATPLNELQQIKQLLANTLQKQQAQTGIIRAALVTDAGHTFDWSMIGNMSRILLRNAGPDSVWIAFNEDGPNTPPTTGNGSIEVQAQEAWSIPNILFQKIGLRCATGDTAKVHSIAFKQSFGDFGGGIV